MAYTGIDKEIYDSGTHFRPLQEYTQQQWTPPAIMGQNTNAGITNTQAAGSYMGYPSYEAWLLAQGGGGNGGGNDPVDNINRGGINQNLGPTNITDYESEAYGVGPTWGGTWARAQDFYSQLPTPTNLLRRGWKGIQKWRGDRKIAEEKRVADEIAAHNKAAADAAMASQVQQNIQTYGSGNRPNIGMNEPGGGTGQSPTGGDVEGTPFAQGGRIGYRTAGPVFGHDEPSEPILDFMQDQNIPFSEQVEGEEGILEHLVAKYIEAGFPPDQAEAMAMKEFQQMAMGSEQDQGIASLV